MTSGKFQKSKDVISKRSAPRERNLSKTGLITLISVCSLAILASRIPNLLGPARDTYVCTSSLAHGMNGSKVGSKVWLGGIVCGEVLEIRTSVHSKTNIPIRIEAVFDLNQDIQLRQDATLNLSASLTGADSVLQIADLGRLTQPWPVDSPRLISLNEIREGSRSAIGILGAKSVSETKRFALDAIDKARPLIKDISATVDQIRSQIRMLMTNMNDAVPRWKAEAEAIINPRESWEKRWTRIRAVLTQMGTELEPLKQLMVWIRGDGTTQVDRIRIAIASIRKNTQGIQSQFIDVEQYAQKTLTKGRTTIDHGRKLIQRVQKAVPNMKMNYNHIRARNSLAGAQLSLLFKDILGTAFTAITTVPNEASWNRRILFESIESVNLAIESLNQTNQILELVITTNSTTLKENPRVLELLTQAVANDSKNINQQLQELYQLFLRRTAK